jgi:hypothetical protein
MMDLATKPVALRRKAEPVAAEMTTRRAVAIQKAATPVVAKAELAVLTREDRTPTYGLNASITKTACSLQ